MGNRIGCTVRNTKRSPTAASIWIKGDEKTQKTANTDGNTNSSTKETVTCVCEQELKSTGSFWEDDRQNLYLFRLALVQNQLRVIERGLKLGCHRVSFLPGENGSSSSWWRKQRTIPASDTTFLTTTSLGGAVGKSAAATDSTSSLERSSTPRSAGGVTPSQLCHGAAVSFSFPERSTTPEDLPPPVPLRSPLYWTLYGNHLDVMYRLLWFDFTADEMYHNNSCHTRRLRFNHECELRLALDHCYSQRRNNLPQLAQLYWLLVGIESEYPELIGYFSTLLDEAKCIEIANWLNLFMRQSCLTATTTAATILPAVLYDNLIAAYIFDAKLYRTFPPPKFTKSSPSRYSSVSSSSASPVSSLVSKPKRNSILQQLRHSFSSSSCCSETTSKQPGVSVITNRRCSESTGLHVTHQSVRACLSATSRSASVVIAATG
jgi:hypothetical protein